MPSAGNLNPRNTSTDNLIINQGNPLLKPSHKDNVTLGYMFTNGIIRLYPYIAYTYDSDLVMPYSYLDGEVYVNTYQNFGHTGQLMPGASLDYNFPQKENQYGNISLNVYYLKQYIKGMPFSGNSYNVTLNGIYGYKKLSFSAYLGLFGQSYTLYSKTRLSLFSNASIYWNVSRAVTLSLYTEGFLWPKMHYKTWVSNGEDYHSFTSSVPRNLAPKIQLGVSYTFVTKNFRWRNQKKFYGSDSELETVKTN